MRRALLMLFLAFPLLAQDPPKTVVLRAARMFAGNTDTMVTPGLVVVTGDRIAAAGASAAIPEGATIIDLGDATLLPGFVDAHTHLSFEMGPNYIADFFTNSFRHSTEQSHFAALYAKRTLDAGFTTVRDLGSYEYVDVGLRNAINAGVIP